MDEVTYNVSQTAGPTPVESHKPDTDPEFIRNMNGIPACVGAARFREKGRKTPFATYFDVDIDEPWEVTGLTCRRNRELNGRLWAELSRVGVSKRDGTASFVSVAGEIRMGSIFPWWSSAFLVGIFDAHFRRVFSFTGTGRHELETWTGDPEKAFRILACLPESAGTDKFWRMFCEVRGYAKKR